MSDMNAAKNQLDKLWYKVKVTAGYCAANADLKNIQEYLQKGEDYTKYAYYMMEGGAASELQKASETIGKVRKGVKAGRQVCIDIAAVGEISDAIDVLNGWVENPRRISNHEAAAAFDKLFGGIGALAEKLPTPFNQYAKILKQISISKFFTNTQEMMDLE